jgi:serine/threonine protein phosphatase PrpC
MKDQFEIVTATIAGTSHTEELKGNEDAFAFKISDNFIIACVADGCSSSEFSALGSNMAVKLLVNKVNDVLITFTLDELKTFTRENFFENIRMYLLSEIFKIACQMDTMQTRKVLDDYFLFTLVVTLITPTRTDIVSIGDGYYGINGKEKEIKTLKDQNMLINKEGIDYNPYLVYAYAAVQGAPNFMKESTKFQTLAIIETNKINTLLIGSDGLDCINEVDRRIDNFCTLNTFFDNEYFSNPDNIIKKLKYARNKLHDVLHDDITMILIRKKQ